MAFKNCAPFRTCDVTINDEHVQKAEDLDIVMPMYNLLEYSDNYQDSTGSAALMIMQMLLMIQQVWCLNQNLLAEQMIIMLIM